MAIETSSAQEAGLPEHYIFDDLLGPEELLWIYHELLSRPAWTLSRTSGGAQGALRPFMSFPGLEIETRGKVHSEFLSGYFRSVVFRVRDLARQRHNIKLPAHVRRIHAGAKSSFSKTSFHADMADDRAWTILGFLNPVWNASDGGDFFLKEHRIDYRSGRFVLFRSNTSHDGGYVTNETLNYWRVAVNIILTDRPADEPRKAAD